MHPCAESVIGAGVVPVAENAADRQFYMLLARERTQPHYRDSSKWSGFEGGRHTHETPAVAAARELYEESLGLLWHSAQHLEHEYVCKCVASCSDRYHITYAIEVPFDPSLVTQFCSRATKLVELQQLVAAHAALSRRIAAETTPRVMLFGDELPHVTNFSRMASDWWASVLKLRKAHAELGPERLAVRGLAPHEYAVQPEYLEKDQVQWFSLDEIDQTLRRRECKGFFRPSFVHVLSELVAVLREHEKNTDGLGRCARTPE